jgi:hypothetical protein
MTIKAAIPDAWRPFGKPRGTRDPVLNLDARAQAFLDRIAPLSADLGAHGRTRALALKKLRRICQAEVRRLKAKLTPATVKLYLSKYRDAIRQIDPDHLVLRPRKMRSGQRFSYLALPPEETRALNAAYHQRIHEDQQDRDRVRLEACAGGMAGFELAIGRSKEDHPSPRPTPGLENLRERRCR